MEIPEQYVKSVLSLTEFRHCFSHSIVDLQQVNAGWDRPIKDLHKTFSHILRMV